MWEVIFGIGFVGVVVGFICLIVWLQERTGRHRKAKIYWDKNLQQIRTKDGRCLWDRRYIQNQIDELVLSRRNWDARISVIEKQESRMLCDFKAQLQCSAKTGGKHKMVYSKLDICLNCFTLGTGQRDYSKRFIFKCSACGLEITKTEKELSAVEKEGLKKLKLL